VTSHPLRSTQIYCNGVVPLNDRANQKVLSYLPTSADRNITIGLPKFVEDVYHLSPRILDLLEIASYLFAADRLFTRGRKNDLEYNSWSRRFEFHIRVRDSAFWNEEEVKNTLVEALLFITGDASYQFAFHPGYSTPPTNLFDREDFKIPRSTDSLAVSLFSGGLDSLAGCIELLETTTSKILLVSHQSQPGTTHTQRQLSNALRRYYPNRILHYEFECHLRGQRASEETQRTRSFLYCSIAFAIAQAYNENRIFVFENGITSINLYRREDLANARASRTTHPKTIYWLEKLFQHVSEDTFRIELPYLFKTKRDVIQKLIQSPHQDLISSSVSCSRTYQNLGQATHCGECFQCADRRIASCGAGAEEYDHEGLYALDIVNTAICNPESRTTVVDYVRQASKFAQWNVDHFQFEYLSDLAELIEFVPIKGNDAEKSDAIWQLAHRHGMEVRDALLKIRNKYDDPYRKIEVHSLLGIISGREHLKPETSRLIESLMKIFRSAIPEMFRLEKPKHEPDLNSKMAALLKTHEPDLRSEHPTKSFGCARVVPDHLIEQADVIIETKYIRGSTTPSKATDGIASDLTKYPQEAHILFFVYDPDHAIPSDFEFTGDIESKGRNTVVILR